MNKIPSYPTNDHAGGLHLVGPLRLDTFRVNGLVSSHQRAVANRDAVNKQRWSTQKSPAKTVWDKLTDEELNQVNGNIHTLIGLVKARYELTQDEAYKQVKLFFAKDAAPAPVSAAWLHRISAAHALWPGLTPKDLLRTEGQAPRLVSLLQTHYIISLSEAERQVKSFLEALH